MIEPSSEARRAIEAILMVADEPLEPHLLAQLLEVSPARVEELCAELVRAYDAEQRGFVLARVANLEPCARRMRQRPASKFERGDNLRRPRPPDPAAADRGAGCRHG